MSDPNATLAAASPHHSSHAAPVIESEQLGPGSLGCIAVDAVETVERAVIVGYLRGYLLHRLYLQRQTALKAPYV